MIQRWTAAVSKPADAGGFVAYGDYLMLESELAALRTAARRALDSCRRLGEVLDGEAELAAALDALTDKR